jgi:hypothetical protein
MISTRKALQLCTIVYCSILSVIAPTANAGAPNTTAANSVPYEVGQGWVTHYFDEATQTRWFKYGEVGGHSYCIEAVQGSVSPIQLDPNLAVFTDATGATALTISGTALTNNDGGGNPNFIKGSRICYIAPTTFGTLTVRSAKVNVPIAASSGDAGNTRLRIVDTTLVGTEVSSTNVQHYLAFVELTNITGQALNSAITFAPASVGSSTISMSLSANSTTKTYLPYGPYVGEYWTIRSGPVFVAHNGAPGTVKGISKVTNPVVDSGSLSNEIGLSINRYETIERPLMPK